MLNTQAADVSDWVFVWHQSVPIITSDSNGPGQWGLVPGSVTVSNNQQSSKGGYRGDVMMCADEQRC